MCSTLMQSIAASVAAGLAVRLPGPVRIGKVDALRRAQIGEAARAAARLRCWRDATRICRSATRSGRRLRRARPRRAGRCRCRSPARRPSLPAQESRRCADQIASWLRWKAGASQPAVGLRRLVRSFRIRRRISPWLHAVVSYRRAIRHGGWPRSKASSAAISGRRRDYPGLFRCFYRGDRAISRLQRAARDLFDVVGALRTADKNEIWEDEMRKLYSTLGGACRRGAGAAGRGQCADNKVAIGMPTTPPNIVHMPVIVAKELGLYKKHGTRRRRPSRSTTASRSIARCWPAISTSA